MEALSMVEATVCCANELDACYSTFLLVDSADDKPYLTELFKVRVSRRILDYDDGTSKECVFLGSRYERKFLPTKKAYSRRLRTELDSVIALLQMFL